MILDTVVYGTITLGDLLYILVVFVAALIISKAITLNLKRALSPKVRKSELDVLLRVIYYSIIFLAVIFALPALDINLSGLLVAGGFAGLIIGFASQSVVSNVVSGLFLIVERPISIGDEIQIGTVQGTVEDIRFLSTVVRKYDGVYARVPNEQVFTSDIINFVANPARRIEYVVGISYSSDIETALRVINQLLDEYPLVLKRPLPDVYVDSLGDSSVNIKVRFWAPAMEWYDVQKEMLKEIKV
ncbi:MAG TPA: mechanosensitive ion channel family protein, partial [Methanomicrobiales archaeon]|nr:mechanosensitive ion channel family protein [Methanomicrobiales archaeon]